MLTCSSPRTGYPFGSKDAARSVSLDPCTLMWSGTHLILDVDCGRGTHLISTHYGIDAPTLSSQCMRCRLLSRVGSRAAPRLPAPPRRPARQPRACRPRPPEPGAPGAAGAGAHTVGRLVARRGRGRTMRYRHFRRVENQYKWNRLA
jgi:hypothetical protein